MLFTVTQMKDFLWCEQMSHNLHVARRGREPSSRALWLGGLFHEGMAQRLLSRAYVPPETVPPEVESDFRTMLPFLHAWQVPPTWRVTAVETSLQVPVGRHTLACRPDALITDEVGTWLVQWKSLGRSFDLGTHQERIRLSFHECGYHFAVATTAPATIHGDDERPPRVAGTILGTYKKLTRSDIAAGRDPFTLVRLPRTWREVVGVVEDMSRIADRMQESIERNQHLKNLDACYGRFGNSLCQYHEVCFGARSLNDPPFVDLPNRYTDLGAQE